MNTVFRPKSAGSVARLFVKLLSCVSMLVALPALAQTSYVWTNIVNGDASGSWRTLANWSPNGFPISGDTADFSTLILSNVNSTISLGGDQTNANLIFGNANPTPTNDWIVDASGTLTLESATAVPTISVTNRSATIQAIVLGTNGFIKLGGGTINESGSQTAGTHLSGDNSGFTGTFNSTGGGSHRVRFDNPNAGSVRRHTRGDKRWPNPARG